MKNFISINTISDICSVSLFINDSLLQTLEKKEEHSHTKFLPILFKQIIENNKITLDDIDYFAVSIGPGSYSGIKVSSNFVKGLSLVTTIPIVPVNQFYAFNLDIHDIGKYYISLFSHTNNIYYQLYEKGLALSDQRCSNYLELDPEIKIYGYLLDKIATIKYHQIIPSSKNIGYYAQKKYDKLLLSDPDDLKSIYLTKEKING